jgi:predicted DNA-binding protein
MKMVRKTPLVTVSAVVTPAIAEEIHRLSAASGMTKSQMVRELLEAKLTERANERQEDAYDRLEKRLKKIEDRFSSLIVKNMKYSAQALYLGMKALEFSGKPQGKSFLDKHWNESLEFAGKAAESKSKKVEE